MAKIIDDQRLRDNANAYRRFPLKEIEYEEFSPEVKAKLEAAEKAVEDEDMRRVECPRCKFLLCYAYGQPSGFLNMRCGKCKFSGVLDLRCFRRMRIRDNEVYDLDAKRWVPRYQVDWSKAEPIPYDGVTPIYKIDKVYEGVVKEENTWRRHLLLKEILGTNKK